MSLEMGALVMGLLAIGIAIKPFLANIKKHNIKVYFTLPGWTLFIFALGLILGFGLSKFEVRESYLILLSLFAFIPLYAWIDAKLIYRKKAWGVMEYIWGCLYELGVVSLGSSLYLFITKCCF